ncbi:hypothetical protein F2Q69_00023096 [Brassica cretica]|uniref:Uncharacterized protein n=1 Tax=Brassica cretica TaxID=69181 RepID=A0A8S9Q7P1_BRACR|nr:hypothetical protein F2Q69_00023096 [Brassica cretica]
MNGGDEVETLSPLYWRLSLRYLVMLYKDCVGERCNQEHRWVNPKYWLTRENLLKVSNMIIVAKPDVLKMKLLKLFYEDTYSVDSFQDCIRGSVVKTLWRQSREAVVAGAFKGDEADTAEEENYVFLYAS